MGQKPDPDSNLVIACFCKQPGEIPKWELWAAQVGQRWTEWAGAGTHQEEGTHGRDLVELYQQAQGLLVVAAVLLVHTELVLLQDKGRAVRCGATGRGRQR